MLRDDVINCIEDLKVLYNHKKELCDKGSAILIEAKQHAKTGNIDGVDECLEELAEMQNLHTVPDFDIAAIYDKLSVILGVKEEFIISTIAEADIEKAESLSNSIQSFLQSMYYSEKNLTEVIVQLDDTMQNLNADISGLSELRKAMEIINH